jgi:hypothetical protein
MILLQGISPAERRKDTMQVDKATAREISRELEEAAEKIFAKHGLQKRKMKTGYGDSYSFSVEAETVTADESGVNLSSKEARGYELFASSYGLPTGLLGKKFKVSGVEYAFAGIATSRPKYPIFALNLSTGDHIFFTEAVKKMLVEA